ncbi:exodeoxyribonuclease V subunit gamma [Rhodocyclus purpureus]|nr:exodeoxyribonuclease V subunit gamma [Rhodocyclus purpureus]
MLVHGNHPEHLRDLLVAWVRRYPVAPLESETLLVQSNGVAQWLRLALAADVADEGSGGCGIAAGICFSLPSAFLWQVYRAVLGREQVPETSPFDKSLLLWRLMRLLPELLELPDYAPLGRFLKSDADLRKRFQLAERLADLFDQYQVYRADWLAAWEAGEDVLIRADGERRPLDAGQRWQASLWRALLADVAREVGHSGDSLSRNGRAAVHAAFLRRVDDWPEGQRPAGLPRRVMVFGISALPRQSLEVLAALARWCQVLMCVHNPCEYYWADIVPDRMLLRATQSRQRRRNGMPAALDEENLHLHAHPLLAAWGKQGRDFIGLLDEHDSEDARAGYLQRFADIQKRIDLFSSHGESCLLNQLQDDIRALRPLAESRPLWPAVAPADDSIRFHVAHSAQREVEMLHDQLLAAFNADPTLRPRDVVVMVPDIEAYAPHIQAVFGLIDSRDARFIPFSIADQGRRHHDPLVNAIARLLELPSSRLAVSDVLDLIEVPALRARFAIADDDLPLLQRWIRGAQVRWGLHAEHRASLGLPNPPAGNTWQFGLRRMLLGYASGATGGAWNGIEPFDEIGGLDAAALGPLAQLLDRLEATWTLFRQEATPSEWCERLRALLADFFRAEEGEDAYTLQQLDAALEGWREACAQGGLASPLPLTVVGEHWLAQLEDGGLSRRFFAGAVTFATLMPMRAIPFRQVCLLGLNDGDYPRTRVPMDFDLMGRDYRPGDRSRREDDRYLFLEALLSARERLLISWVGRSINDNSVRPPSVLVGQLRDHLAAGWKLAGHEDEPEALLAALTVEHRLQPFSPAYFPANAEASPLFTYAREWRIADDAVPDSAVSGLLPPLVRSEPLRIAELADFLRDPVKDFFRKRLHVHFAADNPASEDQEPFDLDGLQKWGLWNELIARQAEALAAGRPREEALAATLASIERRGQLAAGAFARLMAAELAEPMADMFERYAKGLAEWPTPAPHDGEVRYRSAATTNATSIAIEDWLRDLRVDGDGRRARVVLETSDAVKKGKYQRHTLIKHWVAHLAGHLAGEPLTTLVVSKAGDVRFEPLPADAARAEIETLLAAWQEGMRRPLPLAVKTAFAFLDNASNLRAIYEGGYKLEGEVESSPYLQRAWPDFASLTESGEFERLAGQLLGTLFDATFRKKGAKPAGEPA